MLIISIITLQAEVVPQPKQRQGYGGFFYVTTPKLTCVTANNHECPQHIHENFKFFTTLMFQRDTPYNAEEYANISKQAVIETVSLTVQEQNPEINIKQLNEQYEISFNETAIHIVCETSFGASRAFATLMQLVVPQTENTHVYQIQKETVKDNSGYKWRHYGMDACTHYMPVRDIKRIIDASSIQKLNVLLLTVSCSASQNLLFGVAPQNRLASGSWTPHHFYNKNDMKELQEYGRMRGVVIVPEFRLISDAAPWRHADRRLVADCPLLGGQNQNNFALNVVYEKSITYIKGALTELIGNFFPESLKISPIVHLGGQKPNFECWNTDGVIKAYMTEKSLSPQKLWQQYHQKIVNAVQSINKKTVIVFDAAALENDNEMPEGTIIHFTTSSSKVKANDQKLQQLHNVHLYPHLMHPNGGHHYFWQDTWHDMYRINIAEGSKDGLALGGGVIQHSHNCYARSCEQHAFDRSFGVADNLWKGSSSSGWGSTRLYESLGCRFEVIGLGNGPLEIGAPCPGYKKK